MATNWIGIGAVVAILAAGYYFRCKIPYLNKYLCPGSTMWEESMGGLPQGLSPTEQVPLPGGGMGTAIKAPPPGIPDQFNPDASYARASLAKIHGRRRR